MFGIELLQLLILLIAVIGLLFLNLPLAGGENVHLDHALFALQGDREEHQLDDNGKQNQGKPELPEKS